ncbi:unnamed protein product [Ceratitis capitata]|uniref:(Mediterranean fruit fly) hypothetical protein n=1 Tax=Ceratitis capitata TaxID=7213 RepID=A0A811UG82_CERCA|nr:unnamed protein product [Ceratitis capitata]CAD6997681.1 unnamed protein product [Ceratitis capitata]
MEDLRSTVTNLTGAVNAILEKMNSLERRVVRLDTISAAVTMKNWQLLNHRPQFQSRERSGHVRAQQPFRPPYQSSAQFRNQPVEKMEVDSSIQSRAVNYMNRPNPHKRGTKSANLPRKHQRLFYSTTDMREEAPSNDAQEDFLSEGHLAYHT